MELTYVYTAPRTEFGRQCSFSESGGILFDIKQDKSLQSKYMDRNPVNRDTITQKIQAEHSTITESVDTSDHGMNHTEGSWPKDVNPNDIEQTSRFRKKIERDEGYLATVKGLAAPMEHVIHQNNAVNIYEEYFESMPFLTLDLPPTARKVSVFRDVQTPERPVNHIAWPSDSSLIAVSYCDANYKDPPVKLSTTSYIWDLEAPNAPVVTLLPKTQLTCMQFSPKDPNTLVSGLMSGKVALWDIRSGSTPVEESLIEISHHYPVSYVQAIHSKAGSEFFSTSGDGQVKFWDARHLGAPTEVLILDMEKGEQDISRALGASYLEYDLNLPTKFMVGTQNGLIISCNRKAKTPAEMLVGKYEAHIGPVSSIQRNPILLKNFLSIGDWSAKIWVEEVKTSAIIWTKYDEAMLTSGYWSPTRFSVFFTTKIDGTMDIWDLLLDQREPHLNFKVCEDKLTSMVIHEEGRHIAVGNKAGAVNVIEVAEHLAESAKKDRPVFTTIMDRETHREKLIEGKARELLLKMKLSKPKEREESVESLVEVVPKEIIAAEKNFYVTMRAELGDKVQDSVGVLQEVLTEIKADEEAEAERKRKEAEEEAERQRLEAEAREAERLRLAEAEKAEKAEEAEGGAP